jgi:hypothetical protein
MREGLGYDYRALGGMYVDLEESRITSGGRGASVAFFLIFIVIHQLAYN